LKAAIHGRFDRFREKSRGCFLILPAGPTPGTLQLRPAKEFFEISSVFLGRPSHSPGDLESGILSTFICTGEFFRRGIVSDELGEYSCSDPLIGELENQIGFRDIAKFGFDAVSFPYL
tara:strand:- start:24872 stop:25225 length:354 start_codon:yes stop_codon:yes gene_type:complete